MLTNKLSGVIFDLDNTLVSSSLDFSQIRATIGCPPQTNILAYVDSLSATEQLIAKKLLIDHEMEDAQQSQTLNGAPELLDFLMQVNIPHAVVTRNCREAALLKMANNRIHIPLLLTREDHKAKPIPDALLYVAEHWVLATKSILCVGDHLYDLQAAKNANMLSCLVTNGNEVEYADLANIVVSDLAELKSFIKKQRQEIDYE